MLCRANKLDTGEYAVNISADEGRSPGGQHGAQP